MRHWFFLVILVAGLGILTTLTAQAAAAPAADTVGAPAYCEPIGDDPRECRPVKRPAAPTPVPVPIAIPAQSVLPFTYAYVVTGPVKFYANPADADNGAAPKRTLDMGYLWVRLAGQTSHNGQTWYLTDGGGYLPAAITALYRPSAFHGTTIQDQPGAPFAWVLGYLKPSPRPGAKADPEAIMFKRYELVNIYEEREAGGQMWYRVGENQWIVQTALAIASKKQPPEQVKPGDKWIEVSLYEQTLAAYEGDRIVYATLVSSGLPQWPTVKGLFNIHTKIALGPMQGREGKPDFYSLEDVPWSMYFYQDYALHGAYWHDDFGWQHSHGCVNLAPLDSKWLYEWTTPATPLNGNASAPKDAPGTWVWVHD